METHIPTSNADEKKKSRLFYIPDSCHGYIFLFETCDEISVIPPTTRDHLTPALYKLQAQNGTKIYACGVKSFTLIFLYPT